MAKKPTPPIEVICPCCQSKLTVDPELSVVLSHVSPPKAAPDVDINDAARILAEQARKREDKFRHSLQAGSKEEDVLIRKWQGALKKAKDHPSENRMREFELEYRIVHPNEVSPSPRFRVF